MSAHDSDYVIPGQRRPGLFTVVMVSVATSALVSVAAVMLLPRLAPEVLTSPEPQAAVADGSAARVPDVTGMAAEAADELLAARKLRLVVTERRADAAKAGSVIVQSPLAQSRIDVGGQVAVVLSTGLARSKVPDVVGQPLEQARAAVEAAGLHVGPVAEADTGEAGHITATSPAPGTELDPGTSIALTVARPKVAVPGLLGVHIRSAREQIVKAGFTVGDVSEIYDEHKRGYLVLSQDPDPGALAEPGSKIALVVNQGD